MRAIAAVLVLLGCATIVSAQERREWDLRSLTAARTARRAPQIGFWPGGDNAVGVGTQNDGISGDDILIILSQTVNAGAWDSGDNSIDYSNGLLRATAQPEILKRLAAEIEILQAQEARTVVIEVEILELGPGAADGLAPGILDEAAAAALRAAAADKARGRVVHHLVARGAAGTWALASSLRRRTYVHDFDIEIAQQASIPDPVMRELEDGALFEARPRFASGDDLVHLELRLQTAVLAELADFKLPALSGGRLELPRVNCTEIRTYIAVPPGRTALVAATGYRASTPGWTTTLLVRARVEGAPAPANAAAAEGDVFCSYNVGALLHLPPFGVSPPKLGLENPQEEMGPGG